MNSNREIYNRYLKSCKMKNPNTADTTYRMYKSRMEDFFNWLEREDYNENIVSHNFIKNIIFTIEDYAIDCRERGNNAVTINNKITAISSFYFWAFRRDIIEYHPFAGKLERIKVSEFDKVRKSYFLTLDEVGYIRSYLENEDPKKQLIFNILYDTAARRTAVSSLKVEQFSEELGIFTNVKEKGGKRVDLVLSDYTVKIIKKYIEDNNLEKSNYLIYSRNNKNKRCISSIVSTIRFVGRLVNINDLYPHSIRKTRINHINDKFGIGLASEYANHGDTITTKNHYIKSKNGVDLRKIIFCEE